MLIKKDLDDRPEAYLEKWPLDSHIEKEALELMASYIKYAHENPDYEPKIEKPLRAKTIGEALDLDEEYDFYRNMMEQFPVEKE